MFETIVNLKPKEQWRAGVTIDGLIAEMDKALQFPGVSNAWTMPIKARIDMLSTGIRTPVGVKVIGADLVEIDRLAKQIEQVLEGGARHLVGLCRANASAATISTSRRTARRSRATASWSRTSRTPSRPRSAARR